jgi:hypothetical protein
MNIKKTKTRDVVVDGTLLLIGLPKEAYDELNAENEKIQKQNEDAPDILDVELIKEDEFEVKHIQESNFVGVHAIGEEVTKYSIGDVVMCRSFAALTRVSLGGEETDLYAVRESDIILRIK